MNRRRFQYMSFLFVFLLTLASSGLASVHLYDGDGLNGQLLGYSVAALADQNNDDAAELLIGSPEYNGTGSNNGRAYIWFGGTSINFSAEWVYEGTGGEWCGFDVACVGDVNNDGTVDYAVGAPKSNVNGIDSGKVYVFYGGTPLPGTADVELSGLAAGDEFGFSVSAAGDFNGDGFDDLIVGAPYANTPGENAGNAYVFYGGSSGIETTPDLTLTGAVAGDLFGWSVAGAGNFTDGVDCVVIGAPKDDAGGIDAGGAYVFAGSTSPTPGPNTDADVTMHGNTYSEFGTVVEVVGRWNSDGYDDIAVGAPYDNSAGADAGRTEIFYGAANADATADRYVNGQNAGDNFGWSLAAVGDVQGSTADDLLIGAPLYSADASDGGRAYLYLGGSNNYADAVSCEIVTAAGVQPGALADDRYGWAVSTAGDFDGDGDLDYAVGAVGGNVSNNTPAGFVQIFDSSGQTTPTVVAGWEAAWIADTSVELSLVFSTSPDLVENIRLTRFLHASSDRTPTSFVVVDGAPDDTTLPLYREGRTWSIIDMPGQAAREMILSYSLELRYTDGRTVTLPPLAGPTPQALARVAELQAAWPNPFNPNTSLRFRAPAGAPCECRVFDLRGRHLTTLFSGPATGHWMTVNWNGMAAGSPVSAGTYLVSLVTDDRIVSRTVTLAK